MKRLLTLLAAVLVALAPASLEAQQAPSRGRTIVRVAKWALLGTAVGFGVYALANSRRAESVYADLRDVCAATPPACQLSGGRYAGAEAERLYQRTLSADQRAQIGITVGQVALLGSVALFLYDLRDEPPPDIPFPAPPDSAARPDTTGAPSPARAALFRPLARRARPVHN